MTTALIVDDSKIDRELVATLLQGSTSLQVAFADDGADALRQLAKSEPDMIITDLHMPEVDGLRLVETVREQHAHVPIVLITGQGSENLAVQALKTGAASYVPKVSLATELVPTVMQVLALSRADRGVKAVQRCWQETRCVFQIPNDYNLITPLVQQLRQLVEAMQLFDETECVQLSIALEAALSNALYHGNLELSSEQVHSVGYDLNDPDAENVVDSRILEPPYRDRSIFINAEMTRDAVTFTIRDEGPGFDHRQLPDPEAVVASGQLSGRGLAQMRLFSDELTFNDPGNEVMLRKRVAGD